MEGRFEFMQHFIALGFIKVSPWNLRKKQANGWDRVNIYFDPECLTAMVTVNGETMKIRLFYDQFKDAPMAYNVLREYFRSCFIKSVENKLKEIL